MTMTKTKNIIFTFIIALLFSSCFTVSDQQGVDNLWREESRAQDITEGITNQNEIIKLFGPPSQIINLDTGSVFYYLLQEKRGKGAFLLIYNFKTERVNYDRAIFFFNKDGVLTDYGFSIEEIDRN